MGIRLRDDVFFSNPESRIREYCEIEVYAGYDNQHSENNVIRFADLDAANNLYAMIDRYDKTESRRILDQSGKLSPLLSEIPNTPIFEFNDDEWTNIKSLVEKLLVKFVSIYGVGIAKATKILHLKRPELFPVLDSYVIQFLTGKNLSSSNRDVRLALQSLDTSKQLIQTQINEFKQLQNTVNDLPIPLTVVRLFDILCWSTYKWDIQRKTTAPRGKATKSLIEYKKTKPKINLKQVKTTFRSTKPKKKTALSPMAPTIVLDFFSDLSSRAKYGIEGEKPIAVLAVIKYLMDTKQMGIKFLDLLDYPYYEKVRITFIETAERYGNLSSSSSSWSVITGTNMELQNAIKDNGKVNQALNDLTELEIESTFKILQNKYQKGTQE